MHVGNCFFLEKEATIEYRKQKKSNDARKKKYSEESEGLTDEDELNNNASDSEAELELLRSHAEIVPQQSNGKRLRTRPDRLGAIDYRYKTKRAKAQRSTLALHPFVN